MRILLSVFLAFSPVAASPAYAYLTPEEVLLNQQLYLPPTSREAAERVERQSRVSGERREQEQEAFFEAQRPEELPEDVFGTPLLSDDILDNGTHGAAPFVDIEDFTNADLLNLRETVRLLNRVQSQQQILSYPGGQLHGGAPLAPLAPTGAGAMLSMIVMIAATGWTLMRAGRGSTQVLVMKE